MLSRFLRKEPCLLKGPFQQLRKTTNIFKETQEMRNEERILSYDTNLSDGAYFKILILIPRSVYKFCAVTVLMGSGRTESIKISHRGSRCSFFQGRCTSKFEIIGPGTSIDDDEFYT